MNYRALDVTMKTWLRCVGRAVGFGLAWAIVWAPVAVLVGTTIVDPDNSMDELWVAVGVYPGFLCGVILFVLVGMAEGHRRFEELPLSRVATWGAVAGLLVGVLPFALGDSNTAVAAWLLGVVVVGSITLLSVVSALGSAMLLRAVERRQSHALAG